MFQKVPKSRDEITLPWLNAVLSKHDLLVHSYKWTGSIDEGLAVMGCLERLTLQVSRISPTDLNNNCSMDENNNVELETLDLIVKTLPNGPAGLRHFVINEGFCRRELKMYTKVFPAWEKFQNSRNTPRKYRFRRPACYYGAEDGTGDDYTMIIIMEDMFSSDFQLWPHGFKKGLNWKQAKPIVKQIALFHAAGMAYKDHHNIKNYNDEYEFLHTASKDPEAFKFFLKSGIEQTIARLETGTTNDENAVPVPPGLVSDLANFAGEMDKIQELKFPKEGRAGTICHHDLHVNNIMLPRDTLRGEAALLDFQGCCYSSPMNDLTFFLMLNCDPSLFTSSGLPRVLQCYQTAFASAMKSMNVDVEYSLEQISEDYASCVIVTVIHIIMGAPSWCFGPRTSENTWSRFRMALVDSYNRWGLQLPIDL